MLFWLKASSLEPFAFCCICKMTLLSLKISASLDCALLEEDFFDYSSFDDSLLGYCIFFLDMCSGSPARNGSSSSTGKFFDLAPSAQLFIRGIVASVEKSVIRIESREHIKQPFNVWLVGMGDVEPVYPLKELDLFLGYFQRPILHLLQKVHSPQLFFLELI